MLTIDVHATFAQSGGAISGLRNVCRALARLIVRCLDERRSLRSLGTGARYPIVPTTRVQPDLSGAAKGLLIILAIIGPLLATAMWPMA
jgi:hypothetical protein